MGGHDEAPSDAAARLSLVQLKEPEQAVHVGHLKVVRAGLDLAAQAELAVGEVVVPANLGERTHTLQHHDDALEPIGEFHGDWVQLQSAGLLEVGVLADLLPVQPHFPAQAPGAECRGLPVVFDKAHVVHGRINAEGSQAVQVALLRVAGIRLQDHLVLVVLLPAVGVLAVAPVRRPHRRLEVGDVPGLGTQHPQGRGRVQRAGADLAVVRMPDHTTVIGPELAEAHDNSLEIHNRHPSSRRVRAICPTCPARPMGDAPREALAPAGGQLVLQAPEESGRL